MLESKFGLDQVSDLKVAYTNGHPNVRWAERVVINHFFELLEGAGHFSIIVVDD